MRKIIIIGLITVLLAGCTTNKSVVIVVENDTEVNRIDQIVEVPWEKLSAKLDGISTKLIEVGDLDREKKLLSQKVDEDGDGKNDLLIFQTDIPQYTKKTYRVKLVEEKDDSLKKNKVYGRFVPERKDDFAWENDKTAFRTYGPALKDELISSGIDVWSKSVGYLIIDKWYEDGHYHEDHGEGADFYSVGKSLGCGAPGIIYQDSLYFSHNFADWDIIEEGPLRLIFELTYDSLMIAGNRITETRRISLDAGSFLNHIEVKFEHVDDERLPLDIVAGIKIHQDVQILKNRENNYLGLWEQIDEIHGYIGTGIVPGTSKINKILQLDDHLLALFDSDIEHNLSYFSGACWSKGGMINDAEEWKYYLKNYHKLVEGNVNVIVK